jgi:hypothetical protein
LAVTDELADELAHGLPRGHGVRAARLPRVVGGDPTMSRMVDLDELVTVADIAGIIGRTRTRAFAVARDPTFPAPLATIGTNLRVWRRSDVVAWAAEHRPSPPEHGRRGYKDGCRCDVCRKARADYWQDLKARRAAR